MMWQRLLAGMWRGIPQWLQWRIMWLLNAKFTVGVTGVIFDQSGQLLLAKHTYRRRFPWGLVSGWVQHGEPLEQALTREVAEETGLRIRGTHLFLVRAHPWMPTIEVVYLCDLAGGTFRPSGEISEVRWCRPDALPTDLHPDHRPLIEVAAHAPRQRKNRT